MMMVGLLVGGCAAPCELATVLSAYEAESQACVRLSDTRDKAEACLVEVQQKYLPRLQELGEEAVEELKNVK